MRLTSIGICLHLSHVTLVNSTYMHVLIDPSDITDITMPCKFLKSNVESCIHHTWRICVNLSKVLVQLYVFGRQAIRTTKVVHCRCKLAFDELQQPQLSLRFSSTRSRGGRSMEENYMQVISPRHGMYQESRCAGNTDCCPPHVN